MQRIRIAILIFCFVFHVLLYHFCMKFSNVFIRYNNFYLVSWLFSNAHIFITHNSQQKDRQYDDLQIFQFKSITLHLCKIFYINKIVYLKFSNVAFITKLKATPSLSLSCSNISTNIYLASMLFTITQQQTYQFIFIFFVCTCLMSSLINTNRHSLYTSNFEAILVKVTSNNH